MPSGNAVLNYTQKPNQRLTLTTVALRCQQTVGPSIWTRSQTKIFYNHRGTKTSVWDLPAGAEVDDLPAGAEVDSDSEP